MSHEATTWAFKIRGLKPGARMVLFMLANRHNPDFGCFPSQELLASDCEIDERTVRRHLKSLENAGLVHRIRRPKKSGGHYQSDRYILAFETDFPGPAKPADNLSKERSSRPDKNDRNARTKCPPNLVREPVRNARARTRAKSSDPASFWAMKINAKEFIPSTAVSLVLAREMLQRSLVTSEALQEAGVSV